MSDFLGGDALQLRHLRYFIAVAEQGSIIQAARRLRVAQPAVSRQMQDLEREVGCALFKRLPRGIRLTRAGEAFLLEAKRTLETAAEAVESARRAGGQARDRLTLAVGRMTQYPSVLPRLIGRFKDEHPDTVIATRAMSDIEQYATIQSGRASVAIAWLCKAPDKQFDYYIIEDCAITGVVMPAAHPVARQSEISLAQLQPLTRLHHHRRHSASMYRQLRTALHQRGLEPAGHRAVAMDPTSIGMHVAAGDAFLLVTKEMAGSYTEGNDAVVYRPFTDPPIPLALAVIWSRVRKSGKVDAFIETARGLGGRIEAVA
jgi:DNA-binding transcriptional LysR family regulator